MSKIISTILIVLFFAQSFCYAVDLDCIVGECSKGKEVSQEDEYECICPPKDTVETITDIIGVFSIPFQFFSNKPNFVTGGNALESLIKKGCKCRLKAKKEEQEHN